MIKFLPEVVIFFTSNSTNWETLFHKERVVDSIFSGGLVKNLI